MILYRSISKMKYLLLLVCFLASCDDSSNHTTQKVEQVEYIEKYCPHCNGVGKVKMSTGDRVILGILTFGPGALCDTETCETCRGTGVIKVRKLKNE